MSTWYNCTNQEAFIRYLLSACACTLPLLRDLHVVVDSTGNIAAVLLRLVVSDTNKVIILKIVIIHSIIMKPVCVTCNVQCKNIADYCKHCRTHRHSRNFRFCCCIPGCKRTFYTYKALVSHITRDHSDSNPVRASDPYRHVGTGVKCKLEFCQHNCSDIKDLLSHFFFHVLYIYDQFIQIRHVNSQYTNKMYYLKQ